jgi:hypothetical protein
MLDRSRFSALTAIGVLDAGWLLCQTRSRRSATPFMAYSLQPTVALDISYWRGNAPLDQEKAGGRYAADLILQLPARAGSAALHSAS